MLPTRVRANFLDPEQGTMVATGRPRLVTTTARRVSATGSRIFRQRSLNFPNEPRTVSPEFPVLPYLWDREGRVVSRADLLDDVWEPERFRTTRT